MAQPDAPLWFSVLGFRTPYPATRLAARPEAWALAAGTVEVVAAHSFAPPGCVF
ncbi:MAG TPA: hypothetical protein VEH31_17175 [Streptosporangiaceae bacterium]|nr:hypothetical protein [Streptosporangiaceae bacterium]